MVGNGFSLLSLNTFGIPFFLSRGRLPRLTNELEQLSTTIICLQEIQQNSYTALLEKGLRTYPYRTIFRHILAPKGGLGIFSRLPLAQPKFEHYRDRGLRWLITFADWALLKGILVARVQFEELEVIIVNTHLNANYCGDWRRKNPLVATQYRQVQQLSHLVGEIPEHALIVLCGDFNFPRSSFLYDELIVQNGLFDPLRDDPKSSYRPFPMVSSKWKTSLDYILLRIPQERELHVAADVMLVEDSNKKNAFQRFLTDHCALMVNISW